MSIRCRTGFAEVEIGFVLRNDPEEDSSEPKRQNSKLWKNLQNLNLTQFQQCNSLPYSSKVSSSSTAHLPHCVGIVIAAKSVICPRRPTGQVYRIPSGQANLC